MRSDMTIASSWSCVTKIKVMPTSRCSAFSSHLHLPAQVGVERGERFVEKQQTRAVHERASERDALLLAAADLGRLSLGEG